MKVDLTPILQALILLMSALITSKLIPFLKSKTSENQFERLVNASKVAVFAAEQMFNSGEGSQKREYVLGMLKESGFDVDTRILRAALEKAVYDMKNQPNITDLVDTLSAKTGYEIPPIEDWPVETLKEFCELNDIPHENCSTKEEFVNAIATGSSLKPTAEKETE